VTDRTGASTGGQGFEHTARYDGAIASYLGARLGDEPEAFPANFNLQFRLAQGMRYGENPHQGAAFYVEDRGREASVATARQLQGKELSFNNIATPMPPSSASSSSTARQPASSSSTPTPVASRSAPLSSRLRPRLQDRPGVRVRRHHRGPTASSTPRPPGRSSNGSSSR